MKMMDSRYPPWQAFFTLFVILSFVLTSLLAGAGARDGTGHASGVALLFRTPVALRQAGT
jgi:hypothetical protein